MSRVSRVPYHQNVYDLLGIEPGECPEAARMIAEHEAQHGPLPASVREWYLVPNAVPLRHKLLPILPPTPDRRSLFQDYADDVSVVALDHVLRRFGTTPDGIVELTHEFDGFWWLLRAHGSDDPPVRYTWERGEWLEDVVSFSEFLAEHFVLGYMSPYVRAVRGPQPHSNGLWLRAPGEPFQPPVIDFLTDQFGEPERTQRTGHVTTYHFRPAGGILRITADEPALAGGLSAWWVHAETPERLAEFAALLMPWGTLRDTLRADTDPARAVLSRARDS